MTETLVCTVASIIALLIALSMWDSYNRVIQRLSSLVFGTSLALMFLVGLFVGHMAH